MIGISGRGLDWFRKQFVLVGAIGVGRRVIGIGRGSDWY